MCHARAPVWGRDPVAAPRALVLESEADIARHAGQIYLHAAVSHAMPPPNAVQMTGEDRAALARWYRGAVDGS